jgi:hypothetical protein
VTQPFHGYEKGQEITDPDEVARLSEDREHHFVRVFYQPAPGAPSQPAPIPSDAAEHHDV